ncbi:MAG: MBL fold metallo-hydrolase [Candidatus Hodarchaeales archaeon]|jgi:hydroxyacylglutathione hydrolase
MKQISRGITWLLGQGMDCNVFIIESEKDSLLVDSGLGRTINYNFGAQTDSLKTLEKILLQKNVNQVFLTHAHIDHVGGIMALQGKLDLKVFTSEIEAQHLKIGDNSYIEPFFNSKCEPIEIAVELKDKANIDIGHFSFQVLYTPGHTKGSSCLWDEEHHVLVSGDTVFPQGSFGRVDLPSGSSEEMVASLRRLSELKVTTFLPGHMPPMVSTSESLSNSIENSFKNARMMFSNY